MIKNILKSSGQIITLAIGQTYQLKDDEVFINNNIYLKKDLEIALSGNSVLNNSENVKIGIKKRDGISNLPADLSKFNEWSIDNITPLNLSDSLLSIINSIKPISNLIDTNSQQTITGEKTFTSIISETLNLSSIQVFADDASAGTGGLVAGDCYKTATGELRIKL